MKQYIKNILFFAIILLCANCQNQEIKNGNYYEQIGTLKLNYTIKGKGPVMIVGHPNSGKIGYELTLKPLEKYFTMVYYEPRGTGKSQAPETLEEYNSEFIVKEIDDLRTKLAVDKIGLFGHSDQSAIALEYALKYPNQVYGLILTGTSWIGSQKETYQRRKESEKKRAAESAWFAQVLKDWDYLVQYNTKVDENGKDISNAPLKWWCYNEESAQKVISIAKEIAKAGRRKSINKEYYKETEAERQKYLDYQNQFSKIKAKTLIINGKYDTNNPPEYAEKLHDVLPNSKLVLIDETGHFPWLENPDKTFIEIEDWIQSIKE